MKQVTVRVTYECGRCGNVQRRTYTSQDGLLIIPQAYCGCCIRRNNFTVMSNVVSNGEVTEVETANKGSEVQGPVGRSDVPAAGRAPETTGAPAEGRVDTDKPDGGTREPETGVGGAQGLHNVPPVKAKVVGKPVK